MRFPFNNIVLINTTYTIFKKSDYIHILELQKSLDTKLPVYYESVKKTLIN